MLDLLDHSDIRHPLKVRSEADLGRKALCAHTVTHRVTVDHRISRLPNKETQKDTGTCISQVTYAANAFEGVQENK